VFFLLRLTFGKAQLPHSWSSSRIRWKRSLPDFTPSPDIDTYRSCDVCFSFVNGQRRRRQGIYATPWSWHVRHVTTHPVAGAFEVQPPLAASAQKHQWE
jgi:hypothetical protein